MKPSTGAITEMGQILLPSPDIHVQVSEFHLNSKSAWWRSRPSCPTCIHPSPQGKDKRLGLPLAPSAPVRRKGKLPFALVR